MTKRPDATVRLLAAACVSSFSGVSFGQGACEVAKLLARNGQADDHLGYSVSIDGNTAVVGAFFAVMVHHGDDRIQPVDQVGPGGK